MPSSPGFAEELIEAGKARGPRSAVSVYNGLAALRRGAGYPDRHSQRAHAGGHPRAARDRYGDDGPGGALGFADLDSPGTRLSISARGQHGDGRFRFRAWTSRRSLRSTGRMKNQGHCLRHLRGRREATPAHPGRSQVWPGPSSIILEARAPRHAGDAPATSRA